MNFNRMARHYDWLEALTAGGRLQRARTAWLNELQGRRRILSAGEGHGRFAAACAGRFPDAELTCIEASPKMLDRGQNRTRGLPVRVRWHCGDVMAWEPEGKHDAIVTCFFLDCFPPPMLAAIIAKLAACAADDAVWLVVDFSVPALGFPRWRAQALHALMYAFFRHAVALPARRFTPPDSLLRAHGFVLKGHREFNLGLLRAEVWRRG